MFGGSNSHRREANDDALAWQRLACLDEPRPRLALVAIVDRRILLPAVENGGAGSDQLLFSFVHGRVAVKGIPVTVVQRSLHDKGDRVLRSDDLLGLLGGVWCPDAEVGIG